MRISALTQNGKENAYHIIGPEHKITSPQNAPDWPVGLAQFTLLATVEHSSGEQTELTQRGKERGCSTFVTVNPLGIGSGTRVNALQQRGIKQNENERFISVGLTSLYDLFRSLETLQRARECVNFSYRDA